MYKSKYMAFLFNLLLFTGHKVAEVSASRGQLTPANLLWMEYLLAGKEQEADSLWRLWLHDANSLFFRRLLQESHVRKEPELIEKLIKLLKSNQKLSPGALGNAYNRLINLHLTESRTNDALEVFERAMKSGVSVSHLNKSCVERLKTIAQAEGKDFKYPVDS